jgi:hypothetical protein
MLILLVLLACGVAVDIMVLAKKQKTAANQWSLHRVSKFQTEKNGMTIMECILQTNVP